MRQGDWLTVERARAVGQENIPSGFTLLWHGMKRNAAYSGLIAGEAEQMLDMHDRTRSSILKVATTATEFLDGPPMQRLLEASDFDLEALKTDPEGLTIYLTLPQRYMSTHYRWLRLMISLAVGDMERIKGRPATGYPTLFVLDEFAGLKRMEAVENAAAQAAGFGVKFLFVLQNLPQLKEIYDDSWETFLGNSGLRLFFQIDDNFTRTTSPSRSASARWCVKRDPARSPDLCRPRSPAAIRAALPTAPPLPSPTAPVLPSRTGRPPGPHHRRPMA